MPATDAPTPPLADRHRALLESLRAVVQRELGSAVALRHTLHADPELGWQERRTSRRIAEALPGPAEPVAGTGLVRREGPAEGPCIALRAELDGLALQERTDAPYQPPAGLMHACGHDVHLAALTAVARAAHRVELPVGLLSVFQPAEEVHPSGARRLLEEGTLVPHDVRGMVGVHVHHLPPRRAVALGAGAVNASSDLVRITVEGDGGHGAYPHQSRDPVLALGHTLVALQQVVSRRADPMLGSVLSFGTVSAGTAANVIPSEASTAGILRCLDGTERERLRSAVRRIAEATATAHDCSARVEIIDREPILENDPVLAAHLRATLPALGVPVAEAMRSCGADDFSHFGQVAPICMLFLGVADPAAGGHQPPLHHPTFLPPDDAVADAAHALVAGYVAGVAALEEAR